MRGALSSFGTSCERNATFALISGSTRGSLSTKRILTVTVAFERSTVGTSRCTSPRKRPSGSASSWISRGWPSLHLADVRFGHVGFDFERRHVGHRDDRRLRSERRRKRRDHVADVRVLGEHDAVERRADQRLLDGDLRRAVVRARRGDRRAKAR